ncbi:MULTISPECIES: glycoside hydrolase family 16 protein [unclassified Streptomyces]|uniref:glycoside hydrolase family 16 protein n=1 Tax=Streptomyces sp. NPDC006678 TaxID=3157185 RepID=UPI0033E4EB0C
MVSHRSVLRRLIGTCAALAACVGAAAAPAGAEEPPSLVDPATPAGVQPLGSTARAAQALVFSDEFTGTSLDTSKWTARDQERTESSRTDGIRWWYKPANVRVITSDGGNLALDLTRLADRQYAGGRVDSQGKFDYTHGTLEARVHTPYATNGHLAAVWLQASGGHGSTPGTAADGAEYDITETADQADTYPVTIHYDGYAAEHKQSSATVSAPGLHSSWYHTYGMSWTPTRIQFTYDGAVVRTVTDPKLISLVREFPILSHEVLQFADGSVTNAPLDSSSTVYVDHIRVWQ